MDSKRRVMVIGLDGATFDLIKPWVEEGKLPNFKKLLLEGCHGVLESTTPSATIPAWPSFFTGCNPGKHGFYDFFKERSNSYDMTVELHPSKAVKQPTLWQILSDFDKKVALLSIPGTYPPKRVNGFMVTGLLTPPNVKFTYPPEFQDELKEKIGGYNLFFSVLSAKNPDILLEDLEKTLFNRVKAVEYIWKEKRPDFLMMVDNGTDRAEHELWKFIDIKNPLYDPDEVKRFGNPLLKYYQTVDKTLERIRDMLDEDTILIIMSDHGQGPLRKFVNLNMFLIKEGYMVIKKNALSKLKYQLFSIGFTPRNIYNLLREIGIERYASDNLSQERKLSLLNKMFFSTKDINWKETVAFSSGVTGAITINVKGRQSQGIINKNDDYAEVRKKIIDQLLQLYDKEIKGKVINKVYKREEIYYGPYLDNAPDIVAVPSEGYEFFGMFGFPFNQIIMPTFGNSGSHRRNGIFIAIGKDIKKDTKIKNANIIDLAPTILHIMDAPIPINVDGKIIFEIFEKNCILAHKKLKYKEFYHEKEILRRVIKESKISEIKGADNNSTE